MAQLHRSHQSPVRRHSGILVVCVFAGAAVIALTHFGQAR
jgi:hypothetical protein